MDLAKRIEDEGFSGIFCPGRGDSIGLCESIVVATRRITVGTNIVNLYNRDARDYAHSAALLNELSGERFVLGVGLGPVEPGRFRGTPGRPLHDVREFVGSYRSTPDEPSLPPIIIGTLRKGMVRLAGEVADGCIWANGALSHIADSLSVIEDRRPDFLVGNVIRVCVTDDVQAGAAALRQRLRGYLLQPQYPNYWIEAGYVEDMEAVLRLAKTGERNGLDALMSDEWLEDVTILGNAYQVIQQVESWYDAGVTALSLEPVSTSGDDARGFEEVFQAFSLVD